jgi:hypothetical protein
MARRGKQTLHRTVVREKTGLCMSCPHATVRIPSERSGLKVWCGKGHRSAVACPDYQDDGRAELLHAIVRHMRRTQTGYREVFNAVEPDCPNCTQNCCVQPFLNKTPFYGEDAIYYLLIGQPLPNVPKDADHCVFFDSGCTLPSHLRPHVCIEYACPFIENPPAIDTLGEHMQQDTVYLIAVATREYEDWRGVYEQKDGRGVATGVIIDRFDSAWDPQNPLADLRVRYELDPAPGARRRHRLPVLGAQTT